MKCNNCGYENVDGAVYCENCGNKISETSNNSNNEFRNNRDYNYNYEPKKKSPLGKILAAIVLVVIIGGGAFFGLNYKKNSEIKELQSQLEVERLDKNYKNMITINQKLYDLTGDESYKEEISSIIKAKENEEKRENVVNLINNGELEESLSIIKNLENSTSGEEVSLLKSKFSKKVNEIVTTYNSNKDYEYSRNLLNSLLGIDADNENLKNLLDATNKKEEAEKQEADKKAKEDAAKENKAKKNSKKNTLQSIGEGLIGKTIYVSAQSANIRSGPGTDYAHIYTISKGDGVYVVGYTVNSRGILWLNTGDGWVSYKNFDGSLKY